MLTEKELIAKLQSLKQVKPNQDWVVLAKNQILNSPVAPAQTALLVSIMKVFYQPKLAYSLAVFMVAVIGIFAYTNMNMNVPAQQPQVLVKSNVEQLKLTSQSLATAVVGKQKSDIAIAAVKVNKATQNLTQAIVENPGLAKDIAVEVKNNKTYLEILGDHDLKQSSDMLYKAIDQQMIDDLKNTTLTESQQKLLDEVTDLYEQGEYAKVLEKILLIK